MDSLATERIVREDSLAIERILMPKKGVSCNREDFLAIERILFQ